VLFRPFHQKRKKALQKTPVNTQSKMNLDFAAKYPDSTSVLGEFQKNTYFKKLKIEQRVAVDRGMEEEDTPR